MKQRYRRIHRNMWIVIGILLILAMTTLLVGRQSLTPGAGYDRPAIFDVGSEAS